MNGNKREFSLKLYNQCDMPSKVAAVSLMKSRGYELHQDIDKEFYKQFDLVFINEEGNIIKIENEFRANFRTIKNVYSTVHIPIRKKNSECDYYFVWGIEYTELGIIKMDDIIKFRDKPVNVLCTKAMELYEGDAYTEDFIDVPKEYVQFYKLNSKGKWKKN